MLPVVKRKTLEIPHGLAAIAAAICLALAFATDFQSREQALRAELEVPAPQEVVVTPNDEFARERVNSQDPSPQPRPKREQGRRATSLLPWFPGLRTGG
jgi:hypothetical protein